jgi:hypothetical protein
MKQLPNMVFEAAASTRKSSIEVVEFNKISDMGPRVHAFTFVFDPATTTMKEGHNWPLGQHA